MQLNIVFWPMEWVNNIPSVEACEDSCFLESWVCPFL